MSDPARRRASYEDVLHAPPHMVAEVIDGELELQPRPAGAHARVASRLFGDLDGPFDRGRGGPGGWILLFEPEVHLGEDVLVPDLAGWRRERLPAVPDAAYFVLAPDWVCEVVSPSTARLDRVSKLAIYARERVRHVWLVDPRARTLEVFRRADEGWLLTGSFRDEQTVRAEPFDAVALDLRDLWADLAPAP
jgi:Uma2 family endonuclease